MVCMEMKVFFQQRIQNNFSENRVRHRNPLRGADPHFDVGEYVREIKQSFPHQWIKFINPKISEFSVYKPCNYRLL